MSANVARVEVIQALHVKVSNFTTHPVSTRGIQAGSLKATVACSVCRPGLRPIFENLIFAGVTCLSTTALHRVSP